MAQKKKGELLLPGYLAVSRKFFDHPLWTERIKFNKREAWLDLMQSAWYGDKPAERFVKGILVKYYRGEVVASERFLQRRWLWPKTTVGSFLRLLETEKMIARRTECNLTIITLINYCAYNGGVSNPTWTAISEKQRKSGPDNGPANGPHKTIDNKEVMKIYGPDNGPGDGPPSDHPRTKIEERIEESKKEYREEPKAPPPSHEEIIFNEFSSWVDRKAPTVNQMKEPFTAEQYTRIRGEFTKETVQDVILAMHNSPTLLKKYRSANLTLRSWIRIRGEKKKTLPTNGKKVGEELRAAREAEHNQNATNGQSATV